MSGAEVLIVEPTASGGLAAHVRDEIAALTSAGVGVERSTAVIGPRPAPRADLRAVRTLLTSLRGSGAPSTVHAHGLRAGALTALAARFMRRSERPRLVVTLHNRTVGTLSALAIGLGLALAIARTADAVLAVSPDLLASQRRLGARDAALAVVPAAPPRQAGSAELAAARTLWPRDDAVLRCVTLARLAPQKGLDVLLDAVAIAESRRPGGIALVIAGDGPLGARLRARIEEERLPVSLVGRRDDVGALLAVSQAAVSAAAWEGQPVWLQEALHAGCPVIATDAGGTSAVTGSAAMLVPVGDAPALAAALLAVQDERVRSRLARASAERAAQLPDRDDMATQLRSVLAPRGIHW